MKKSVSILALAVMIAGTALGHPHFNKTVTAKLPSGAEAKVSYNTTPANEQHARDAAPGSFLTPRRPLLELSADVQAGAVKIPAGTYTIGVVKNGADDWTMALYPGQIGRGDEPDTAKLIELESTYDGSAGSAEHMLIDITPGSGKLEGRAVLTLHFGSMFLSGALS